MLSCFQKKGFYRLGFLTVNYGDMIGYYSNSGVVGKVLMIFLSCLSHTCMVLHRKWWVMYSFNIQYIWFIFFSPFCYNKEYTFCKLWFVESVMTLNFISYGGMLDYTYRSVMGSIPASGRVTKGLLLETVSSTFTSLLSWFLRLLLV